MLEIIVLGIIPGTNFVFTVTWALIGLLIVFLVILFQYERKHRLAMPAKTEDFSFDLTTLDA